MSEGCRNAVREKDNSWGQSLKELVGGLELDYN